MTLQSSQKLEKRKKMISLGKIGIFKILNFWQINLTFYFI